MKLLLDTHILLAFVDDRLPSLGPAVERIVGDSRVEPYASVASIWEIAIKWRAGKLNMRLRPDDLAEFFVEIGISILPIEARHVVAPFDPEPPTRDPFDRLLLSICHADGLKLVTIDRALRSHPLSFGVSLS
ncbi:type II toxin-antitoxin system VapC family toxin [Methyloraptor flagellatus]|uniref:Type II toxin-antitoxin system VapC family toxin n=1 Tax=Methyloraptor flagellatus TaxID=3162530 RepID=A0AAU7XAW6_9HYPH